jgi:hypothetical protein
MTREQITTEDSTDDRIRHPEVEVTGGQVISEEAVRLEVDEGAQP